ncbi:MAG TPA: response regulator [Bryobacteraceae bacterium]|nr:response regulator [Bryobacteraceae bacterium]
MQVVYSVPLLVTGIAAAVLMAYIWKRRNVPAAAPLLGLLWSLAFWCIPCAFEPLSSTVAARLLWMRLELPAITGLSAFYLLVALQYTGFRVPRWAYAALFVVPATIQVTAWTNSQWYWRRIWIDTASPLRLTGIDWGPAFWCFLVYGWLAVVVAILLIVRQFVRAKGPRRRETGIFLASTAAPLIANVPDVLGLTPGWPDLTPFAFGLTAAGIAWVLFRFRFQAIIPVAWRAIFENMTDGVLVLDAESRVLVMNAAAERFLDTHNERVIGRPIDTASDTCLTFRRLIETGNTEGDIELGSGNDQRTCEVRASQLADKRSQVIGHILTIRDVSASRAAARELNEARHAAEAASRAKSQFLATMSHEIRTPMNGVLGLTQLALEAGLTGEQREFIQGARDSADTLLAIINDILDFSKIESGKLDLNPAPLALRETIARIAKPLAFHAAEKGLELMVDVRPEVPDHLSADSTRLAQILTNVAGNAVKFTARGEVEMCVALDGIAGSRARLHFSVRDTGIGIPPDKRESIFDPFSQADASIAREFGGTGLGLTISSRLVQLMGGRIWVESEPGAGSCFHFTVETGVLPSAADVQTGADIDLQGVRVMVVDDNAATCRILSEMLRALGMNPSTAAAADEALAALRRSARSTPFRLAVIDCHMPEADGFSLVERIQECGELAELAILMLTSASGQGDLGRCERLSLAAHVPKPVSPSQLLGAVRRAVAARSETGGREPLAAALRSPDMSTLHILLAEDNPVNRLVAERLLEKRGHTVTVAATGREALQIMQHANFDLVLMDVRMPEMDGFAATAAIRQKELGTAMHIPIIALTADAMVGDRERCLAAGMDGYIPKPVRIQDLVSEMNRLQRAGKIGVLVDTDRE